MLKDLAIPGGYVHAGSSGAGHYVKLVHNGIEFGMLQAIGEGLDLLKRYPEDLHIADTLECWRHGSVIRSWLIDLMARSYRADPNLTRATDFIEDTGEVNWLISDALSFDVPVPVIAQAVMMILKSRDKGRIADKAIIEMRHEFGGHPYGPNDAIRTEREHGRIGPAYNFITRKV
jgi:6-phosphogluconate dehydrogenase